MINTTFKNFRKKHTPFTPYYKHCNFFTAFIILCLILGCFYASFSVSLLNGSGLYTNNTNGYAIVCKATSNKPVFARIITDDTPFFADSEGVNQAFTLPYTYYVKVLDKGELLSHVEFGAEGSAVIDGYVPTDKLFFDEQEVLTPYPAVIITTVATTSLYADKGASERTQYIFAGRQLKFLGFWSFNGEHGCYVEYNGKTGYVKEEEIVPFELKLHPNPLTFLQEENNQINQQVSSSEDSAKPLRILIIVCLLFAGVLALFIVTSKKGKHTQVAVGYYDENDYE